MTVLRSLVVEDRVVVEHLMRVEISLQPGNKGARGEAPGPVDTYEMTFTMPHGLVAHQRIAVSGTNTVSYVTGGDVDSMGLFTSTPVGHGSQSYYVAASPHGPRDEVEERLQLQEHIADELLKDDTRALAKMRFQQGAFVSEDRSIVRYLRYVRSFPTNDPSRWLS